MKIHALIATAAMFVSTTAMADTFSFKASASASFGTSGYTSGRPMIRDHRTPERTPVYQAAQTYNYHPALQVPPAGVDCRNWDPFLDRSSACSVYSTGYVAPLRIAGPWTALGSRESSVPDMQYITVERSFNQLWVAPIQGRPALTSVAIKFMDGTWQTVNLDSSFARGEGELINVKGGGRRQISQVVFHTAPGAHGSYSVFAL